MDLSGVKRLIIIRLSSLGDILLTTPLIRSIKNKFPEIEIDFVLKEQYKQALQLNPFLSALHIYKSQPDEKKLLLNDLKKRNYNLIIDLQNSFRSAGIRRNISAPSVKFRKRSLDKFLLVKFKFNRLKDAPQIPVRYAGTINNFQLDDEGLDFFLPENIKPQLNDSGKHIGFAPGSRHFTKMWPKEYFIELGNRLTEEGFKIDIFGGEDDLQTCDYVSGKIQGSNNLCNSNDLFQTAAGMKNCSAVVCGDSGLMHLASAIKIPVFTIFGSTVKEFGFTPYNCKSIVFENEGLDCRPCTHIGRDKCPKKHFKCMVELTPISAYNKLKLFLNSR